MCQRPNRVSQVGPQEEKKKEIKEGGGREKEEKDVVVVVAAVAAGVSSSNSSSGSSSRSIPIIYSPKNGWLGHGGVKNDVDKHKRISPRCGTRSRRSVAVSTSVSTSCVRYSSSSSSSPHHTSTPVSLHTITPIHNAGGSAARPTPHSPKRAACGPPLGRSVGV